MSTARGNMDVDAWASLLYSDYTFVRHQPNIAVPREEWIVMGEAMKNLKMEFH